MSLNKVMLIGYLGRDPEVRTIPNGNKVANFSIATDESYTDKNGQKVKQSEWHRIVMWRGLAEVAEKYLRKGSLVFIEGKIKTRSWENDSGSKQYVTEIVADSMKMLSFPKTSSGNSTTQTQAQEQQGSSNMPPAPEDGLPF